MALFQIDAYLFITVQFCNARRDSVQNVYESTNLMINKNVDNLTGLISKVVNFVDPAKKTKTSKIRSQELNKNSNINENGRADPKQISYEAEDGEEYPVEALGKELASAVHAIHKISQAPLGLCAQSVLAAVSLCVQSIALIQLPNQKPKPTSLYTLSVGVSGERKSTVDGRAFEAVYEYEEGNRLIYKRLLKEFLAAIKNGEEAVEPISPIMMAQEPTYEGLMKMIENSRGSVALANDDGAGFLTGHSMRDDSRATCATGLSQLWDGKGASRPRANGNDEPVCNRAFCLNIMIQGRYIPVIFSLELIEQGLACRMLLCFPESTIGTRLYNEVDDKTWSDFEAYKNRQTEILNRPIKYKTDAPKELDRRVIHLGAEAKELWIDFYNYVEVNSGKGKKFGEIQGFSSKLPENTGRIAANLALYNDPDCEVITAKHMANAIKLSNYYISEIQRVLEARDHNKGKGEAEDFLEWAQKHSKNGYIHIEQIQKNAPKRMRKKEVYEQLIDILESHHWIWPVENVKTDGQVHKKAWEVIMPS